MRRHHQAISASDLSAAFLDKEHVYTAGEAIFWAAALGPESAARAALVARPLTYPWRHAHMRSTIYRTVESFTATFKVGDVTVTKFFMHPALVQRLHQLAQARKGKGQEARGRLARGFSSHGRGPWGQEGRRAPGQAPQ